MKLYLLSQELKLLIKFCLLRSDDYWISFHFYFFRSFLRLLRSEELLSSEKDGFTLALLIAQQGFRQNPFQLTVYLYLGTLNPPFGALSNFNPWIARYKTLWHAFPPPVTNNLQIHLLIQIQHHQISFATQYHPPPPPNATRVSENRNFKTSCENLRTRRAQHRGNDRSIDRPGPAAPTRFMVEV